MKLNDAQIENLCKKKDLVTPYDRKYLQPHSIDLTLGSDFKIPIAEEKGKFRTIFRSKNSPFILHPKEFVLARTIETINLPQNILGFVCGKSSIARWGIATEEAGLIDAGFSGTITLEVYNKSPWDIKLTPGMAICQAYFNKVKKPSIKNYSKDGHYNNQQDSTQSCIQM